MKSDRLLTRRSWLAAAGAIALPRALHGAEKFKSLFNGRDLSGWQGDPLLWKIEDEVLVGRSPGISYNDFLATEARFEDFVLRFDVWLQDNQGNSGMQFRSERIPGSMEMVGYQADIGPGWWGSLYDESRRRRTLAEADPAAIAKALRPDEWNQYEVRAEGRRIQLSLNGEITAEYEEESDDIGRSGRLAVQIHSGPPLEVRFRNIRIREL